MSNDTETPTQSAEDEAFATYADQIDEALRDFCSPEELEASDDAILDMVSGYFAEYPRELLHPFRAANRIAEGLSLGMGE